MLESSKIQESITMDDWSVDNLTFKKNYLKPRKIFKILSHLIYLFSCINHYQNSYKFQICYFRFYALFFILIGLEINLALIGYIYAKGQTKSKWFFQVNVSSKKRTKEFNFTTMRLIFVCFLEEIEDTKKTFRN